MPPFANRLVRCAIRSGRLARALGCLVALLLAPLACAADVAIVLSGAEPAYLDFAAALHQALPADSPHRLVDAGSVNGRIDRSALDRADLVIAVGTGAAEAMAARAGHPILAVMVARQNITALHARYPQALLSAIVLDQPPLRQMRLVRAALPEARRIGLLLGPQSAVLRAQLSAAAAGQGLELDIQQIDDRAELLPALEHLLAADDAILALPDAVVFNVDSARAILLTLYRYRRPLIGYSRAYVGAGSLAAVYSSAADIARQVAEWLASRTADRMVLPPVQAPRYFSVAVNRQVARALALDVADEHTLADALEPGQRP